MDTFYLGTHKPGWLGRVAVPLFVSRRWLALRRTLPRARAPWALDSGGFTELALHGGYATPRADYIGQARRFRDEVGRLEWAAIQDWMCEPAMLKRTGLTIREHQARSCDSYAALLDEAPDVRWCPVLQGWRLGDYLEHLDLYARRGLSLEGRLVGVGSVCRRQAMSEAAAIIYRLAGLGLRLHGFGVKLTGLRRFAAELESADSMAWSYRGRRAGRHLDCAHRAGNNCVHFALTWRAAVLAAIAQATVQPSLFRAGASR